MAPAPFIGSLFDRWRNRIFPLTRRTFRTPTPTDPRHRLGRQGEELAARHLRRCGYKILYRRFRETGGEIDLVCRQADTLVFVEVKTRASLAHGRPAEAVDAAKERLIIRGALAWLRLLDRPEIIFRFDIVEVLLAPGGQPEFAVIQNAFTLPQSYIY